MTELRKLVYTYLQLPWHERIRIYHAMDWNAGTSPKSQHEQDVDFFRWVKDNNKLDELKELIACIKLPDIT